MRTQIYLALLLVAVAVTGCATRYQPDSFNGGYTDVQLNATTFRISVEGNGYTSTDRAQKIALLRAADLTLQSGGTHFIVEGQNIASQQVGVTPATATIVGGTLIVNQGSPIIKPNGTMIMRIVRAGDPLFSTAYDAAIIKAQLTPQLTQ